MATYTATNYNQTVHSNDHTYYDIVLRNYVSDNRPSDSLQLQFSESRDTPLIPNAKDYFMSIVRFQIDTYDLPVLFFQVENDQADPNLGTYTVTLEYDDGAGGKTTAPFENVIWTPQKTKVPVPAAPNTTPNGLQVPSEYYYCLDYAYFINLVNEALERAMTALQVLVADAVFNTVEPPFLVWENDMKKATLYARESHFDSQAAAGVPFVSIFFNRSLHSLFSTFPVLKFDYPVQEKKFYQIMCRRFNGEKVVTIPEFGIDKLIKVQQELSTIGQWTPISSIVFTTSTVPVVPNVLSNPIVYVDGNPQQLTRTYKHYSNIISDISTDECGYRPELLYNPSAQYRIIDLQNDQPLYQFDIQVYWKDKFGFLRPFNLPPNSSCSMKILFQKKTAAI
jgi:hypothetical protein